MGNELEVLFPIRRINPNERRIVTGYITRLFVFGKGIIQPTIWEDDEKYCTYAL